MKTLLPLSLLCISSSVFAQVEAKKTASIKQYVKPSLSLTTLYYAEQGENSPIDERIQLRPNLGLSFLDGAYDVNIIPRYNRAFNSTQVQRQLTDIYVSTSLKNPLGLSIVPYYQHTIPGSGAASHSANLELSASHTLPTTIGAFTLVGTLDGGASFSNGEQTSKTKVDPSVKTEGLGLTKSDDGELEAKKNNPDLGISYITGVSYKPSFAKKFKLYLENTVSVSSKEQITINTDGESDSKYKQTESTIQLISLSYQASDKLSFHNNFYIYQSGLFEDSDERYLNRFGLTYKVY